MSLWRPRSIRQMLLFNLRLTVQARLHFVLSFRASVPFHTYFSLFNVQFIFHSPFSFSFLMKPWLFPFRKYVLESSSQAEYFCPGVQNYFLGLYAILSRSKTDLGRAIAQAVSRRLPTAAARVQSRVWSCGILWRIKVALGQVFSENFGFPCHSTFHLLLHNHLHYHPRLVQ
jgi:hypothetical protein